MKPTTPTTEGPSDAAIAQAVTDFPSLLSYWRWMAEVARIDAERAYSGAIKNEFLRNAAQYDQCIHQVETILARELDATRTPPAQGGGGEDGPWACFHCHDTFTDRESAYMHFGATEIETPACQFPGGVLEELRRTQEENARLREEDGPVHRSMHRMACEHTQALLREEEKGYARGLRDAALATQQQARGEVFDRALETSRRRSAVELLLSQGYEWKFNRWLLNHLPAPTHSAHGGSTSPTPCPPTRYLPPAYCGAHGGSGEGSITTEELQRRMAAGEKYTTRDYVVNPEPPTGASDAEVEAVGEVVGGINYLGLDAPAGTAVNLFVKLPPGTKLFTRSPARVGGVTDATPLIRFDGDSVEAVVQHLLTAGYACDGDYEDFFMGVKNAMEGALTQQASP